MSFAFIKKIIPANRKFRWLLLLIFVPILAACSGVQGTSSWPGISADDGRVYVSYANQVIAIDGESGQQVWQYNGDTGGVQFYAAPLVSNGQVIVGDYGASGGIFSGGRLSVKVHAIENGDANPPQTAWVAEDQVNGRIFAPILQVENRLFVGTGNNSFVALDATTGNLIWEVMTGNAIWGRPLHVDGTVYFTSLDKNVYALSADNGNIVWSTTLNGASAGSPVYNEEADLLYVGSFSGALVALNRSDGEIAWRAPAEDWVWGTPTLIDGTVYFSDLSGNVFAVDGETGESVWSRSVQVNGSVESQILFTEDQLFVASGDEETASGTLTALTLDGETIWQKALPAPLQSPPVTLQGDPVVTYVPEGEPIEVVRLARSDGGIVWQFTPPTDEE